MGGVVIGGVCLVGFWERCVVCAGGGMGYVELEGENGQAFRYAVATGEVVIIRRKPSARSAPATRCRSKKLRLFVMARRQSRLEPRAFASLALVLVSSPEPSVLWVADESVALVNVGFCRTASAFQSIGIAGCEGGGSQLVPVRL